MKTMTCRQLGGPCDLRHPGETADEVIKAQDRHLREVTSAGDTAHEPAHTEMKSRWRHPKKSMGWYRATKQAFADLPDGPAADTPAAGGSVDVPGYRSGHRAT